MVSGATGLGVVRGEAGRFREELGTLARSRRKATSHLISSLTFQITLMRKVCGGCSKGMGESGKSTFHLGETRKGRGSASFVS